MHFSENVQSLVSYSVAGGAAAVSHAHQPIHDAIGAIQAAEPTAASIIVILTVGVIAVRLVHDTLRLIKFIKEDVNDKGDGG